MKFTKMEGLGNDFVVIDGPRHLTADQIAALCDRRRGVGSDGVLVVAPVSDESVRMEYFNADGGAAEMCGNGLRCVAKRAVDTGLVHKSDFMVETAVGLRRVSVLDDDRVHVELGPIDASASDLEVGGLTVRTVDVGNPHAVLFVDDPAEADVAGIGVALETNPKFPSGTNVEFVRILDDGQIEMRVWERGVGETLACGTGAAAVVAAATAMNRSDPAATVRLPGGSLDVEIDEGIAWLTGPARTVFSGRWDLSTGRTE